MEINDDNVRGDLDLPGALAAGNTEQLRLHTRRIAKRCRYHPRRSQAIIAVIPEKWTLTEGGVFLTNRRGRVCKTGLVIHAHPEMYGNTKLCITPTSLTAGDVITFIRIGFKDIAYDLENEVSIGSIRQEDIDAIFHFE